jgi:antitoxin ParD1/3/4
MVIILTPDQEAWIQSPVASSSFASVEEATRQLIDAQIAQRELDGDDLAWAKPHVDEGIAALERGEFMTLDEHPTRNRAWIAALRR